MTTTLDADVQAAAEQALDSLDDEQRAALVVLQPSSGDILAVGNRPLDDSFDRALDGQYPPGSTFKIVTTDALLRSQSRQTRTRPSPARRRSTSAAALFKNFEGGGGGDEPFSSAFAQSCNTAFVGLADRLSAGALPEAGERFGLGARFDLPVPAYGGQVPEPSDLAATAAAMIGQDRNLASPLGMAGVIATVADGSWHPPRLLADDPRVDGTSADAGDHRPAARPHARGRHLRHRHRARGPLRRAARQERHGRVRHRRPAQNPRLVRRLPRRRRGRGPGRGRRRRRRGRRPDRERLLRGARRRPHPGDAGRWRHDGRVASFHQKGPLRWGERSAILAGRSQGVFGLRGRPSVSRQANGTPVLVARTLEERQSCDPALTRGSSASSSCSFHSSPPHQHRPLRFRPPGSYTPNCARKRDMGVPEHRADSHLHGVFDDQADYCGGVISVPAGGWIHSGCTNVLLGTFTITQLSAITGSITLLLSGGTATGVNFRLVIPAGGISWSNAAGTCRFTLGGTLDKLLTLGTPSLPVTLTTALNIPIAASALTVTSITGTGSPCTVLTVGLAINYRSDPQDQQKHDDRAMNS